MPMRRYSNDVSGSGPHGVNRAVLRRVREIGPIVGLEDSDDAQEEPQREHNIVEIVGDSPKQTVDVETSEPANGAFAAIRPRLFAIAHRMLQNAAEAEDIVQNVWLRWQKMNRRTVENPAAFLATTATRLCLNIARSARSRCEISVGPWFPEPTDRQADPELGAIRGAGLKLAISMLLERLSPAGRAAYILREAFDYSYRQIAGILRIAEANCRQLVVRAQKHLAQGRRASVTPTERLLDALIHACGWEI